MTIIDDIFLAKERTDEKIIEVLKQFSEETGATTSGIKIWYVDGVLNVSVLFEIT